MIVISDTTPIISLMKASRLDLLRELYGVKPLDSNEILAELAQARKDFLDGKGEDFDEAVAEISAKYNLE